MELTLEIIAGVMSTLCGVITFVFWLYRQAMQARIDDLKAGIDRRDSTIRAQAVTIENYMVEVGSLKRRLNGASND